MLSAFQRFHWTASGPMNDTTAYVAAVHEAYQQLTFGNDVEKIGALMQRLETYSPQHAVIPMLRRKLARLAAGPIKPRAA